MRFAIVPTIATLTLAACGTTNTNAPGDASKENTALRSAVGSFITACVGNRQAKNAEAALKSRGFVTVSEDAATKGFSAAFATAELQSNGICTVTSTEGTAAQVTTLLNATLPDASAGALKQNDETWLLTSGAVVLISPDGTMTRTATGA